MPSRTDIEAALEKARAETPRAEGLDEAEAGKELINRRLVHTVYDLEQKFKPVGLVSTIFGGRDKARDRIAMEMLPFVYLKKDKIDAMVVDYLLWRFNAPDKAMPRGIKEGLMLGIARIPKSVREFLKDADAKKVFWSNRL